MRQNQGDYTCLTQLNLDPQSASLTYSGGRTGPRTCQKTEVWVVPQWLGWSSQLISIWIHLSGEKKKKKKTSHITFYGPGTCPLQWPTPCRVCFSISEQIHLFPIAVSLTEFLQWDMTAWASLGPEARHHGFWLGSSPGRESWRTGGKSSEKNVPRNPLHKLLENLLNAWPVLTVFIGLILGLILFPILTT